MSNIKFSAKRLTIDSKYTVDFPRPIKEAFETKNIVIVMLEPDPNILHLGAKGFMRNILGFDLQGNKVWEAELPKAPPKEPSTAGRDYYWCIRYREPLIATSLSSYSCKIDEATGKIEIVETPAKLCPDSAFKLSDSGMRLTIYGKHVVDLPHPIKEAVETKKAIVVLLDPDSYPRVGLRRNLWGFDKQGRKLWEAELPRYSQFDIWIPKEPASEAPDIYWRVEQREPLIASSFSSYTCRINEATGKIESAEFYK